VQPDESRGGDGDRDHRDDGKGKDKKDNKDNKNDDKPKNGNRHRR
jgi:hypothetical protein